MAGPARTPHFADIPFPPGITSQSGVPVPYSKLEIISDLPSYSLLTGNAETITPYIFRATIPKWAHWVPVAGMRRDRALACADAFVRSQIWQALRNKPAEWTDVQCRKVGFILGIARAVIFSDFEISDSRLTSGEVANPVIRVEFGADDAPPRYRILAEDPRSEVERTPGEGGAVPVADPRAEAFKMTDDEKVVLPVLLKSAQAIIPLQGYGLIVEGHQYLSDRSRASFKAFSAVEKQHWRDDRVKTYMDDNQIDVRDLLWNKAGHPVSIALKKFAATSELVREKLMSADLGSAAVRLPAVESEARAISTYLSVTDAVKPSIESVNGVVDNRVLREVNNALAHFPIPVQIDMPGYVDPPPLILGQQVAADGTRTGGTRVTNRKDVLTFAKALIQRCRNKVAICYGYYMAMLEAGEAVGGGAQAGRETLSRAFCLKKLQTECIGYFIQGLETYKDVQAFKAKARKEGRFQAPSHTK